MLSAEDGLADTIRPRLDAAAADPDAVITITGMTGVGEDGVSLFADPSFEERKFGFADD